MGYSALGCCFNALCGLARVISVVSRERRDFMPKGDVLLHCVGVILVIKREIWDFLSWGAVLPHCEERPE